MANQPAMISLRPEQKAEQNHQKSIRMGPQPLTVFNLTRIRPAVILRMFGIYKEKWVFFVCFIGRTQTEKSRRFKPKSVIILHGCRCRGARDRLFRNTDATAQLVSAQAGDLRR